MITETNHVVNAAAKDAQDTLAALKKRWPQAVFSFETTALVVSVQECALGECLWENDPEPEEGCTLGHRCTVCGCKVPF